MFKHIACRKIDIMIKIIFKFLTFFDFDRSKRVKLLTVPMSFYLIINTLYSTLTITEKEDINKLLI